MNQKSFNIFPPYCNNIHLYNISRCNIHIFHKIYIIILLSSFVFKSSESKYTLVWSDDFNGQELNRDKWSPLIDCSGRGNNELQCYTDRTKNVQVYNGSLILTALPESYKNREYTSGRVHAKGPGWMYGFFEARARLPKGKHLWPAIWMVPTIGTYGPWPKSGEIDIMEQRGQVSNSIEGTIHYGYSREVRGKLGSGHLVFPFDFSSDFHTFGFEWTNQSMVWFLDGKKFYSISTNRMFLPPATSSFTPNPISSNVGSHNFGSSKNVGHSSEISKDEKEKKEKDKDSYKYGLYTRKGQPFDQPFKWILNVAVGGGYFPRSLYGDISVSEAKKWEKPFMEVDWIKVYQNVPEKVKKKKLTTRKPLNQPLIEKVTTEKMTTAKDRMTTEKEKLTTEKLITEKLTTEKLITEKLINDKLIAVTNGTSGNESNDIETMTTRKVIPSGDGTSPMMTITTTTQEPSSQVSIKLDAITSNIPPTEIHKNLTSHNSTDQNMTSHNLTSHKLSTQVMTTTIKPLEVESSSTSKSTKIKLITNGEKLITDKLIAEKSITTTPNPITSSRMTTEETTVSLQPVYIPEKHSTIFSSSPSNTSLTPSLIDKLINQSTTSESSLSSPMTTESTTIESPGWKFPSTETLTTKLSTTESLTTKEIPKTKIPTTEVPITEGPAAKIPITEGPTTKIPITEGPTTKIPITEVPTTEIPTTEVPTTEVPITRIPTTEVSTKETSNVENLETFNSTTPNFSIVMSKFSPTTIAMNETSPKEITTPMPSVTMNRTPTISVNYTISSITSVTKPIEIISVSRNDTDTDTNTDTNIDTESSSDPGSESEEYLDNEHESSMNPPNDSGSEKKNHGSDSDKKSNDSDSEKKKSLIGNLKDDKVIIVRVDGDKVTINGHGTIGEGDNVSDEIDLDGQITSDSEGSFVVTTSTHDPISDQLITNDPVSDQSDDTPIEYVYYYYEDEIGKKSSSSAHVKDYADYL